MRRKLRIVTDPSHNTENASNGALEHRTKPALKKAVTQATFADDYKASGGSNGGADASGRHSDSYKARRAHTFHNGGTVPGRSVKVIDIDSPSPAASP
jgi:hypothetical protein